MTKSENDMAKNKPSLQEPIPEFDTLEDIAEFWDTHSTADYEDVTHEVHFEVKLPSRQKPVRLLPELGETLEVIARTRGVSLETLVNVWLTEKVLQGT